MTAMFRGTPAIAATAFAGTPFAMKAMPGPLPMPTSRLSAVNACCSLASPVASEASISRPCLAKMPVWIPMSNGVKVQAKATALPTRSFSAACAGATRSMTSKQRNARENLGTASSLTDAFAALAEIITEFDNLRYGTRVRRVDQK